MTIKVKENEEEVYDIVIDPARGGVDTGAVGNGYKESDITMQMANKLKTKLNVINKVKISTIININNNSELISLSIYLFYTV